MTEQKNEAPPIVKETVPGVAQTSQSSEAILSPLIDALFNVIKVCDPRFISTCNAIGRLNEAHFWIVRALADQQDHNARMAIEKEKQHHAALEAKKSASAITPKNPLAKAGVPSAPTAEPTH